MLHGEPIWRGLRGAVALLVIGLLSSLPFRLSGNEPNTLFLRVHVNGEDTGEIVQIDQLGATLFASREDLAQVGVETHDLGKEVDLSRVAGLGWRYDETRQILVLTLNDARRTPQRLSPQADLAVPLDRTRGAALNYDLALRAGRGTSEDRWQTTASVGIDAWAFIGTARLQTVGLLRFPTGNESAEWQRYETSLQWDFPETALSVSLGDAITSSHGWGRSLRFAGLRVGRDFALRRDIVRRPLPAFEGRVDVPSTVDVFVEGNRVFSQKIEDGRFRIEDIPVVMGAGSAVVSLRGADGRVSREEVSFFGTRSLLARGLADWSFELGYPRFNFGISNAQYANDPLANLTLRYGLTDGVTLEFAASTTRDFRQLAAGLGTVVGNMAEIGVTVGASDHRGMRGGFHHATLSLLPRNGLRLDLSHFRASAGYRDLTFAANHTMTGRKDLPDRARDVISFSLPTKDDRLRFGISHIHIRNDKRQTDLTSFGLSRSLPQRNALFNLNASHEWRRSETLLGFSVSFRSGAHRVQSGYVNRGGAQLTLSRLGTGGPNDRGYDLTISGLGQEAQVRAQYWAKHRLGDVRARVRHTRTRTSTDLRLRGAFAWMDGQLTAGPRINGSFAVVDVGRPDVPVMLQNRPVTRTGRNGRALVAGLQPLSRNRLSVGVADLPEGSSWSSTATTIVPARRAGGVLAVGLSDATTVRMVRVEDRSGTPLPPGTQVRINGRVHPLGIGYDGLLVLEGLRGRARLDAGSCSAEIGAARSGAEPEVIICV